MEFAIVLMLFITAVTCQIPNEVQPNELAELKREVFRISNPGLQNVNFEDKEIGFNTPFKFPDMAIVNISCVAPNESTFRLRMCTDSTCKSIPYQIYSREKGGVTEIVVSHLSKDGKKHVEKTKTLKFSIAGKPLVLTIYRQGTIISLILDNVDINLGLSQSSKLNNIEYVEVLSPVETIKLTVIKSFPKCPREEILCEQRNPEFVTEGLNEKTSQCAPFEQIQRNDSFQKPLCGKNPRCWTDQGKNECSYHYFRNIALSDGDKVTVSGIAHREFSIGFCNDPHCIKKDFNLRVEFEMEMHSNSNRITTAKKLGHEKWDGFKSIASEIKKTHPFTFEFHFVGRHVKIYVQGKRQKGIERSDFKMKNMKYISIGNIQLESVLHNGKEMP